MRLRPLLLVACLALAAPALALDPRLEVSQYGRRSWDQESGLLNSVAQAFAQTRDGYLWVGTQGGLTRFDGTQTVHFTRDVNAPELGKGYIFSLAADPDGSLWIGTSGSGLVRYRDGRFEAFESVTRADAMQIFALDLQSDGTLWMGTNTGVVRRTTDGHLFVFRVDSSSASAGFVRAVLAFEDGRALAGSAAGLTEIRNGTVRRLRMADGMTRAVHALYRDRRGTIWVGTNKGLFRLDGDTVRPAEPSIEAHVSSIREDRHGSLWVGTADGLKRIAAGRVESFSAADGLLANGVAALHEDRQGTLWIGTGGGMTQLRDTLFRPLPRRQRPLDLIVNTLTQDAAGAIWFGTDSGLGRLRDGVMRWYDGSSGLPRVSIYAVTPAPRQGVWIGTYGGGICRVGDGPTRCWDQTNGLAADNVPALLADSGGGVWIGTITGSLQYFADGQFATFGEAHGLTGHPIVGLAPAREGGVWVSMVRGGVLRFAGGRVVERLPLAPKGTFVSVRNVLEDADGTLWIASSDLGLMRWHKGRSTRYRLERFGSDAQAVQLVDDGLGSLWVVSDSGVARIPKSDLHAYAQRRTRSLNVRIYTVSSGLPTASVAGGNVGAIRAADGTLWFGTGKGPASIDPRRELPRSAAPAVLIESMHAGSTLVPPGGEVSAGTGRISFRYTAPDFLDGEKTRFRYKLEGLDPAWIDAGAARSVEYTNLPPGNYTFRVMASNGEAVAAFPFRRLPAFHETPLFRLACVALLALIIVAAVQARLRSLRERELSLIQRVDEQTVRLRDLHAHKQLILNSTADGILELDERGMVTFANAAAVRMLGGSVDDLTGLRIDDVMNDFAERLATARENQNALFSTVEGHSIPVEYSAVPLDAYGRPARLVITFRDITERLAVEEMKKQFVSTVSHELRSPLTSIRAVLGLLTAGKLGVVSDKGRRMVETAIVHTDRLVRLINDILDLDRIEAGRMELTRRVADASAMIALAIEGMQMVADHARVRIVADAESRVLLVDSDRIVQTLTNLLANAIKFSPAGGTVSVSGAVQGGHFLFRVADEGRGVPEDQLETIFERFRQVDASDSRLLGGTGLGLAICRSIVDAHGGRIWAARNGERGSVFQFTIPLPASDELPISSREIVMTSHPSGI